MFQISSVQWYKNKSCTSESLYVYCKLKSMAIAMVIDYQLHNPQYNLTGQKNVLRPEANV